MRLSDLAGYLDDYLCTSLVADDPRAMNGLQVEGPREIRRVGFAVDASTDAVESAVTADVDLLVVHHGLFWGGARPITGPVYQRLGGLIRAEIALYSSHLPLDCHPEVGNSPVLARLLGIAVVGAIEDAGGAPVGVVGEGLGGVGALTGAVRRVLGVSPVVVATGPAEFARTAVVTGAGSGFLARAAAAGCGALITGEGPHHSYHEARDLDINVIYAGHYATETVGLKALARHLESVCGLETAFFDHPTGL